MSRCLVLTDPNVIPTVPALAQSLGKHTLQAPGLSSLSSHPAPIWFNVCVIVIALRWKGLASHNAKKKKKSSLLTARALPAMTWSVSPTPVYHCRGLLRPRGLFCTSCSTQRSNSDHTFLSVSVVV